MQLESRAADVVMLELAGFAVLAAEQVDGKIELLVETVARRVGCSWCG